MIYFELSHGFGYNSRNWLTSIDYAGAGDDVSVNYYNDGSVSFKENSLSKITYGYNNRRLITSETHQIKPSLGSYQFTYDYDALGGMSSMTYPDNSNVAYSPNIFGEAGSAGTFASNVGRFSNGAISAFNYGNGKSRSVGLNARFLPASIVDSGVYSVSYGYDANANPTTINGTGQNLSLGYDNLDRLTTVGGSNAFSYDIQDNLRTTSFAGVQTTINYSGQFVSSVVRGGVTQAVSYDTRGNIIQRGNINFNFNEADQITAIINKNGYPNNPSFWSVAQHGYDPTGHRVVSQSGCSSTHNLYGASGKLLWQVYGVPVVFAAAPVAAKNMARPKSCQASPKLRKYVYLDGQVLVEVETNADNSTKTSYRHNDALGSSRATTDAAGIQTAGVNYGPYGEPVPGTQVRGTGYTGHQMDDDDVTYMGARYYDQTMGRFLSIDPVGVNTGSGSNWNRYAYAGNNPYKFVDLDGREIISINSDNNDELAKLINERTPGVFGFDENNNLKLVSQSGGSTPGSNYYQDKLISAINAEDKINVNIGSTITDRRGNTTDVDLLGGGATTMIPQPDMTREMRVVISGNSNTNVGAGPAQILSHEFVGHAIPSIVGSDTGNAIENENKVNAEMGTKLRDVVDHPEFD